MRTGYPDVTSFSNGCWKITTDARLQEHLGYDGNKTVADGRVALQSPCYYYNYNTIRFYKVSYNYVVIITTKITKPENTGNSILYGNYDYTVIFTNKYDCNTCTYVPVIL